MPIHYQLLHDEITNEDWIETSLHGKTLLTIPQLNKGIAFTEEERHEFGLLGKLPPKVETIDQQTQRAYGQFKAFTSDLQRHIYLNNLHDTNQVLFYRLVYDHLAEMMPLIYTPHIGTVVETFSQQYRKPRGIYIDYPNRNYLDKILSNRTNPDIDLIVVTDGEAVLGIGDQGVGAINIPIAKLMVYALCAGLNPLRTLPIMLDVGTNNEKLLADPLYLGWRHERLQGEQYETFIKLFIEAITKRFPKAFLHWEDFSIRTAHQNLALCENKICAFNDDIQGTGGVALATLLAAVKSIGTHLTDQKIIIFGAGSAGTGIANQVFAAFKRQGLSDTEARERIWLIDRNGLLICNMPGLNPHQTLYARLIDECQGWGRNNLGHISLAETIKWVKPTILIGCSSVGGAFDEEVIRLMANYNERPIIMPLSNPTPNAEAVPADILRWSNGKALIATGSPFLPVVFEDKTIPIAQCNNSVIFPGIGLGIVAVKASKLSADMLWAASETLSHCAPILHDAMGALLPGIAESRQVARKIAIAVANQAMKEGLSQTNIIDVAAAVDRTMWQPRYYRFRKKSHQ
jgi:malate dehydrogenase (oxaloacetate-decarboxylating)